MANDGFYRGMLFGQMITPTASASDLPATAPVSRGGGGSSVGVAIDARFKILEYKREIRRLKAGIEGGVNVVGALAAALRECNPNHPILSRAARDKLFDEGSDRYLQENPEPQYSMLL